jgi:hypothetical protein
MVALHSLLILEKTPQFILTSFAQYNQPRLAAQKKCANAVNPNSGAAVELYGDDGSK